MLERLNMYRSNAWNYMPTLFKLCLNVHTSIQVCKRESQCWQLF